MNTKGLHSSSCFLIFFLIIPAIISSFLSLPLSWTADIWWLHCKIMYQPGNDIVSKAEWLLKLCSHQFENSAKKWSPLIHLNDNSLATQGGCEVYCLLNLTNRQHNVYCAYITTFHTTNSNPQAEIQGCRLSALRNKRKMGLRSSWNKTEAHCLHEKAVLVAYGIFSQCFKVSVGRGVLVVEASPHFSFTHTSIFGVCVTMPAVIFQSGSWAYLGRDFN